MSRSAYALTGQAPCSLTCQVPQSGSQNEGTANAGDQQDGSKILAGILVLTRRRAFVYR